MFNSLPLPAYMLALQTCLVSLAISLDLIFQTDVAMVFAEGHSIEAMSAFFLMAGAVLWFVFGIHRTNPDDWHMPLILFLMSLRELDFDKRFTSEGVMQLRLYSGQSPLWEKAIGLAVIGLILWCGLRLLFRNVPKWWQGIRGGYGTSWLVGIAALLLIVAKTLDGLGRKLAPLGVDITQWQSTFASRTEEVLELAMAILLIQAITWYANALRRKTQPRDTRARLIRSGTRELSGIVG